MNLRRNQPATRRRGIILLVVLAMLTLFAIAGITFVLYANAASESARISRDAETYTTSFPDMDPTQSLNYFLAQFIYGVNDNDPALVESSLRGHSLAENMYGSWDALGNVPSDVPFNGPGRLHEPGLYQGATDGYNMVNYTWFQNADPSFLRDPGCLGSRANQGQARGPYTGGQNAPYTYPDLNSMFLAAIRSSDGMVLQPSYHRDYTGAGGFGSLAPNNPNWTSGAAAKYLTLRPRPAEMGPGFPVPTLNNTNPPSVIPAADVKNLVGSPGGNDSIWMDIGAPTLTTAAGLRYKMLVAPLILDLDNRINLNVVGNILASNNGHASNQGWGPWEINMGQVLTKPNVTNTGPEWPNLFVGNPNNAAPGRYGPDGRPSATFNPSGPLPHLYAQGDLNATTDPSPNAVTNQPYTLPAANAGFFPTFPGSYGNGAASETTNAGGQQIHPMFFNLFTPVGDDKLFALKSHAALMWAGVSASPSSELVQLSPTNFSAADPTTISRIHQTTLLSMDMDRPGAAPYIYDPTAAAYNVAYNVTGPGNGNYTGTGVTATPFPTVNPLPRQGPPAQKGEFDPNTWRSILPGALSRINLNRTLTPYTGAGGNPAQAAADRQQFATDIFIRLINVTGMAAFYTPGAPGTPGSPTNAATPQQYATLRWLAQLSANIVDFIDTDDVMTSFQWAATPQAPDTGYVFGTELPKLVVNEVYLEYDNDMGDPNPNPSPPPAKIATKPYHMNIWAELLNPLPTGADPNDAANGSPVNNANLVNPNGNTPVYQLVITSPNKKLRDPTNLLGDADGPPPGNPPFATQPYNGTGQISGSTNGQILAVVDVSGGGAVKNVTPVGKAQTGPAGPPAAGSGATGFLVIGPNDPPLFQGQPATSRVQMQQQLTVVANDLMGKGMTYSVPNADANADQPLPPTILLQRLANPNLAFNGTPGPNYNPWVTVDYVDMQQVQTAVNGPVVNDARAYNAAGDNPNWKANNNAVQTPTNRHSFGRNQPYEAAATGAQWQQQQAGAPANPAFTQPPTTTFFDVNTPANPAVPPDWLVHLDRPLISPVELLNVSGFRPHELTQQFYKDASGNFQHVAPWTNQTFLLYRLLEFVKTQNAMPGVADGGRVPGKININTIDWSSGSSAVVNALADPEAGNTFVNADVQKIFQSLMNTRTPSGTPSGSDKPFWSLAEGLSSGTNAQPGLAQTLLNSTLQNPTLSNPNMINPPPNHPYQKMELLNKIFNNLTTRSNTFAVWLTVGFFPITNDQVQPNQLGPEINLANGRNIRHHMFAIVDRTQIVTFGNLLSTDPSAIHYAGPGIAAPVAPATTTTAAIGINPIEMDPPTRTDHTWQLQAGSTLVYEPGTPNEETVVIQGAFPNFTANFTKAHATGANVVSRGHPGPMNIPLYSAANDTYVVPYYVIID